MPEDFITPIDLREKRLAAGWTQERLASHFGVSREHVVRIETGARNISFPLALECAKLFGSLRIRKDGVVYTLRPDGSMNPDDPPPTNGTKMPVPEDEEPELGWTEQGLDAAQQADEFARKLSNLGAHVAIARGTECSQPYLIGAYREGHEAYRSIGRWLRRGRIEHPEAEAEGRRRALGVAADVDVAA